MGFLVNSFIEFPDLGFNDTGLVAYWKYDEGSGKIINQSEAAVKIANTDLTVLGGSFGASGIIDEAILLDGTNDNMKTADTAAATWAFLNQNNAKWSIVFWFNATNLTQRHCLFANYVQAGGTAGINCIIDDDPVGQVSFSVGKSGTDDIASTFTAVIPSAGSWNMIYFSYDDSTGKLLYSLNNGTVQTVTGGNLTNTDNPPNVFTQGDNSNNALDTAGKLDEFSIWKDRILTADELTLLYNSGAGLDIY